MIGVSNEAMYVLMEMPYLANLLLNVISAVASQLESMHVFVK